MKYKLITMLLAGASLTAGAAIFNPVTLTSNSYTFDIVVESNTVLAVPYCIDATAGGGTGEGDNSYFEQGMRARPGQTGGNAGIPPHGTILTNMNNSNMKFIMPPTYATNNTLMIDSTFTSGTLNFGTLTTATNLVVLGVGGGGSTTVGYTVNHSSGSPETGSLTFSDWFNTGSFNVWGANGRMDTSGDYDNYTDAAVNNNPPFLDQYSVPVSNPSPVTSIAFTFGSGAHANILAVSGTTAGGIYTPIPVGGFNVMAIIPAAFPLTATMDQGTNTAYNGNLNTWFEVGYATNSPSSGLPPSGSTFASQTQPDHHYQMGVYTNNNAVLIDAGHKVSNIMPASPQPYTAFAFLTAGGNVGGTPMQNYCVLQHADGVSETNLFYGYDWFSTAAPGSLAFQANGRVNMGSRTLDIRSSGNPPYLFETYFTIQDISSPVTNIQVQYKSASSGSSTTYIMAISASTDPIPPVVTSGPLPVEQGVYLGASASLNVLVAGSSPVTNVWLMEQGGVYVPLTDGVDSHGSLIAGSSTPSLTISGITALDLTNYEFMAMNAVGAVTSAPAALGLRGTAGVVPIKNWNNIANETFGLGNTTNIIANDGVSTATLMLSDNGSTNGWNSGITGDGGDYSLMNGFMDANANSSGDALTTITGLTDGRSYDVYLYTLADTTRPNSNTDGLPNYAVNGTTYYAPILGATTPSTYNASGVALGGNGFNGYIPATTFTANDTNKDIATNAFGNYIKIASVIASGGQITVESEIDTTSFRSPLNGIELVDTVSSGKSFGVHFLGRVTDSIYPGTPLAPILDSQSPAANTTEYILTNKSVMTSYSVTIDALSAPPLFYQWFYGVTAIPGGTNSTYSSLATNGAVYTCVITNFAGSVTSGPVTIASYNRPALSAYQQAILNANPVAFWPLTETSGNVAFDYASTNDGTYLGTFTLGNPGLPPTAGMGANTAAGFDGSTAHVDVPLNNLNITGPITVIQWVQPASGTTAFMTTIGHSDASYRLDVTPVAHWADSGPDITDTVNINDGNWHQLIGEYDGTNESLYVDGRFIGAHSAVPTGTTSYDVWIGGDPYWGRYFQGNSCEVAIFNRALATNDLAAINNALEVPPTVTLAPQYPTVYGGGNVTFTATITGGSTPISFQWYYIDNSNNSNNIANATNAAYTLHNLQLAQNGYQYGVTVRNLYGAATAATQLTVQNGPAFSLTDISPLTGEAYAGAPVTYSVGAGGTAPIYYQWTLDGNPIAGGTNASLTLAAPCGVHTIQASYTNAQSAGNVVMSSAASLQGDAYPTNITFFTNGENWQLNGITASPISDNVLTLTTGGAGGNEAASAFYMVPQYVGGFTASFLYTGYGQGDGSAFIVQNCPSEAASLGNGGGALAYDTITNSIAFEMNLYSIVGVGVAVGTNGSHGGYQATGSVNIASGHPIQVILNFANGVLDVSLQDTVTLAAYSTSYPLGPLQNILAGSDLAYVGFSGADGGSVSQQTITDFSFQSVIADLPLTVSPVANGSFTISWPGTDPNYQLQQSASLKSPSWSAAGTPTVVNGTAQVSVSVSGATTQFYRLTRTSPCGVESDLQR